MPSSVRLATKWRMSLNNNYSIALPSFLYSIKMIVLTVNKNAVVGDDVNAVGIFPLLIISYFYFDQFKLISAFNSNICHGAPGRSKVFAEAAPLWIIKDLKNGYRGIPMNKNIRMGSYINIQILSFDIFNMLFSNFPWRYLRCWSNGNKYRYKRNN